MAKTPSTMSELGTPAAPFSLPDVVTGKVVSLESFAANDVLVVMFLCSHCPYVVHVQEEVARFGQDYQGKNVGIVAISSNDATAYPADGPSGLAAQAREQGFRFPICSTNRRTSPAPTKPRAPQTSSFTTRPASWPTAVSSTRAVPVTAFP
jgi:thiol-disulfide isomerase/thioredoxin